MTCPRPFAEPPAASQAAVDLAARLSSEGIPAAPFRDPLGREWINVGLTWRSDLLDALTRLDLVIDETRREIYPYGWEDIHVIGIDVPLFVNLDEARK